MLIEKKLDWRFVIGITLSIILFLAGLLSRELVDKNFNYAAIGIGVSGVLMGFSLFSIWLMLRMYELI